MTLPPMFQMLGMKLLLMLHTILGTTENDGLHALGDNELKWFIISPCNFYYRLWHTLVTVLVVYKAWVSPFHYGFFQKHKEPLFISDCVMSGLFVVDILVTFFVAYINKAYLLVGDQKQIARNYAKPWFFVDIFASFPSIPSSIQPYLAIDITLNIFRLLRLRRVNDLFSRMEKDKNYNYFFVKCVKLIFVTYFVLHVAGCYFYQISVSYSHHEHTSFGETMGNFFEQSLWTRYVITIYWSITTLSKVGYGDLHPVTSGERIFGTLYMFFNLGFTTYVIDNITNLVVNDTSRTKKFRDAIQVASSFAQRNQLSARLQDQIFNHLSWKLRTEELQQQEALDSLPKAMRSSILQQLFYSLVEKVYLFHGVSNKLLFQLVSEMKVEYFYPNEDVILLNEAPTHFYIIVSGAVDSMVLENGVERVIEEAGRGGLCGEIGVISYRPQHFTFRANRLSQLLRLNRTTFLNIIQANVEEGDVIVNNLLQHLREHNDPVIIGILTETQNLIATARIDLPLSLCFAVERGYDDLLLQLLKHLNPNNPDKNGRIALNIAARRGIEKYVLLLVKNGANVNIQDSDGHVPLWAAMCGRDEFISFFLISNSAQLENDNIGQYRQIAMEESNPTFFLNLIIHGETILRKTTLPVAVSNDNAESSRQRENEEESFPPDAQQEFSPEFHEIELLAYNCIMKELYALGPFSEEKEALISALQESLHMKS